MLSAFKAQAVHELKKSDKSKIESLLAYGDTLIVGLNSGGLRIYRVNEEAQNGDAHNPPASPSKTKAIELRREEERFSKKPVQQLARVKEADLLVSLSDGFVSLHDLQEYQLVERLEQTKGAACFTVTSNVVKDSETGVPSLVTRLAVAVKKKSALLDMAGDGTTARCRRSQSRSDNQDFDLGDRYEAVCGHGSGIQHCRYRDTPCHAHQQASITHNRHECYRACRSPVWRREQ